MHRRERPGLRRRCGVAVRGVVGSGSPWPSLARDEYRYSTGRFGEREEYDDAGQTERALEARIKVDQSKERLAAEKKKVASGEVTKAAYAKDEKKHQQLAKQVAADRAELSPERAELVVEIELDSPGAADIVRVQPQVKGVLALDGTIWIIPATLPNPSGEDPEFSQAVAAAGQDVQLAFTGWLGLDRGRVVVERITAHSGHYNAGNTDEQNRHIVETVHRAFTIYGIGAAPGNHGGGGPVAVGGMDSRVRGGVIARVPTALPGARLLSGDAFPHLARGPPDGVALVRITEDDLGDRGSLIAFGWRDAEHVPAGVILVPARVAVIVEQLIAADPAFADWWARLLRHELAFHINGTEHTGHHHDGHAAALAREYDARWRGRGARDDVALRRSRVGEWDPAFLRELATGPPEDALLAVWDAQGMSGTPTPVDAADWRGLLAAGHQPMYRGINGERAEERAEQFRSGERPFVGLAASLGGRGSNFSTDPETAGGFARIVSLPNLFRPMDKQPPAEVVLIGYLRAGAVVLDSRGALERRGSDVAAARRGGHDEVANLIEDLGVWAALRGIDAVFQHSGHLDRHYLVLNRGAMFVGTAGSTAEERSWSGDRWIDCRCGEQHWGTSGAAGLLVVHRAPDGTVWLLMQHRSAANQHSGTWGLFGGARSLRETALRAAVREAGEEAGLDPSTYTVRSIHVDDHGNWSYATVLAETDSLVTPGAPGNETVEVAWVRVDDLATLPLHPGFAAGWPAVSAALLGQAHTLRTAGAHRDPVPDEAPGPGRERRRRNPRPGRRQSPG